MIEITNDSSLSLNQNTIENIAKSLSDRDVELLVVDDAQMQSINYTQRDVDSSTDVLSFPYEKMPMAPLGSIVICEKHVLSKALEYGHTQDEEFILLFIHGMLHLLGYDHEVDDGEMRNKEKELIEKFNLPKSLIVRTQG